MATIIVGMDVIILRFEKVIEMTIKALPARRINDQIVTIVVEISLKLAKGIQMNRRNRNQKGLKRNLNRINRRKIVNKSIKKIFEWLLPMFRSAKN